MPILPLVLVNGADGIGTGWSTSIPNYSPRDIVANLQALLDGRPVTPMKPWYKVGRPVTPMKPWSEVGRRAAGCARARKDRCQTALTKCDDRLSRLAMLQLGRVGRISHCTERLAACCVGMKLSSCQLCAKSLIDPDLGRLPSKYTNCLSRVD